MSELLKVEALCAGYGEAVVLQNISLTLAEGESLALLGRNGTGKTTLLNTLAGATQQHAGQIAFAGRAAHHGIASTGRCRHRVGAARAQHFQITDRARKFDGGGQGPSSRRKQPTLDARTCLRDVSALGRTQDQLGNAIVRW